MPADKTTSELVLPALVPRRVRCSQIKAPSNYRCPGVIQSAVTITRAPSSFFFFFLTVSIFIFFCTIQENAIYVWKSSSKKNAVDFFLGEGPFLPKTYVRIQCLFVWQLIMAPRAGGITSVLKYVIIIIRLLIITIRFPVKVSKDSPQTLVYRYEMPTRRPAEITVFNIINPRHTATGRGWQIYQTMKERCYHRPM